MSLCDAHLWPFDKRGFGTRAVSRGLAALAVAAPLLAGCADGSGFRPMYASVGSDSGLAAKLAMVEIAPLGATRTGQRLRNEMIFQNTGGGEADKPAYRLTILLTESVSTTLVKTNGDSAAGIYNLDAKFSLINIESKKVLLEGTSHTRASYDSSRSVFSNIRASDDAANRAAKTMAEELKGRISTFLSNPRV